MSTPPCELPYAGADQSWVVPAPAQLHLLLARHPLLRAPVIPTTVTVGGTYRVLLITGPNTGGKTVALKTAGLLSLMAQSGLHVPAERGVFPLLEGIACDLGDGQSIEQNLSTFSAHVTRWIEMLKGCGDNTLVLLDELGAGTDPVEGMSLAVAMLEAFAAKNCLILATTHYPEIKAFAANTPGFINARMAFDRQTLLPLYRLELGKAGESCALLIAQRLGLPQDILERAYQVGRIEPLPQAAEQRVTIPEMPEKATAPAEEPEKPKAAGIEIGDSVHVHQLGRTGIVATLPRKGQLEVIIAGKRYTVSEKRISPHLSRKELYPGEDYDLSIVLDTVENRKARHQLERKHVQGLTVKLRPGKDE
jgi:dsDNA-specific endonuclease/ATPase MutS2